MTIRLSLLIGTCVGLLAAVAAAQTPPLLAEVARKEQERRRTIAAPAKVYTNEDLRRGGGPVTTATAPEPLGDAAAEAGAAGQPPEAPPEPGEEPRDEQYWRDRLGAVRAELERNRMFLAALENRVASLWTDFINRGDPAQRAVIEQNRHKALAELERVQGDVERLEQEIRDIEEEARRAGVPPGWLR